MEEKKGIRISFSTFFLILAIIIIIIMGYFIYMFYNDKKIANNTIEDLNNQVKSLENTVDSLQSIIDNVSNTIKDGSVENNASISNENTTTSNINGALKYTQLTSSVLNDEDVFFVTEAIKNTDNTYVLNGVVYKHDDNNINEAQIEDRWILTNDYYSVIVSATLPCGLCFDYEENYKTVDDVFKNYKNALPEFTANPLYEHCFKLTMEGNTCVAIQNVLTGMD